MFQLLILLGILSIASQVIAGRRARRSLNLTDVADPEAACQNVYPYALDIGIYWLSLSVDAGGAPLLDFHKSCPPEWIPPQFVRGRPTVVFTHGAQSGIVQSGAPRFGEDPVFVKLLAPWLKLGWNVGVFQWAQYADEPLSNFERAEAKVWTPRYFMNMKYTYLDEHGNLAVGEGSMTESVSEIFARQLAHTFGILTEAARAELRLVGHSLGSQLVIRTAYLLLQRAAAGIATIMPGRVAALDPVFSPFRHAYLLQEACGETVLDDLGCYITALATAGVAPEIYRSSSINRCIESAEYNPALLGESAYEHLRLNAQGEQSEGYCRNSELFNDPANFPKRVSALINQVYYQHVSVVPYYMLSLYSPPHTCGFAGGGTPSHGSHATCTATKNLALSAAMPTAQVLYWHNRTNESGEKLCFHQYDNGDRSTVGSTMTLDPGDDLFYIASCEHLST